MVHVINNTEELAKLLHDTHFGPEEYEEAMGRPRDSWDEQAEFNKDDYRAWATRILEKARVALK